MVKVSTQKTSDGATLSFLNSTVRPLSLPVPSLLTLSLCSHGRSCEVPTRCSPNSDSTKSDLDPFENNS